MVMHSSEPFHSPASLNSVFTAGFTVHTLLVAKSNKPRTSFMVAKSNLLCTTHASNFNV